MRPSTVHRPDGVRSPDARRVTGVTALTPILWGTTYVTTSELLPSGRPFLAATARALPIGLVFLAHGRRLPHGRWWWRAAVLGLLNIGAFFALLFVAAFRLPGGVAATAGALQPLVAAGVAAIALGEPLARRTVGAGLLGFAGVALLVLRPAARLDAVGIAAALAGTLSMATGVVLAKRWGRPVDLLTFTGWQLTFGGLLLLPVMMIGEGLPSRLTGANVAGFVWLGVFGTGLAYTNWFRGVQLLPIATTSTLVLLSPLVATILGRLVLDQELSAVQVVGALMIAAAVGVQARATAPPVAPDRSPTPPDGTFRGAAPA